MHSAQVPHPAGHRCAFAIAAWRPGGPQGILTVSGGLVMCLHYTRLMNVMKARQPHRLRGQRRDAECQAETRRESDACDGHDARFGEQLSAEGQEPEVYRWTDGTAKLHVTCSLGLPGRLASWELVRSHRRRTRRRIVK